MANEAGMTALMEAISAIQYPAILFLLKHGASPDARDGSEQTPRTIAVQANDLLIFAILHDQEIRDPWVYLKPRPRSAYNYPFHFPRLHIAILLSGKVIPMIFYLCRLGEET
jgi:ankyrin repeat protein